MPFTTNAITLKPMLGLELGQNYEFKLGLSYLFDQKYLESGQYRLIKALYKKGSKNKKDSSECKLSNLLEKTRGV